jgi:hypothetical protein
MTDAQYHRISQQNSRPAPVHSPYSAGYSSSYAAAPGVELEEYEPHKGGDDEYFERSRPTRIQTFEWSDERRARKQMELLRHRFRRNPKLWHIVWPLLARLALEIVLWIAFVGVILYTEEVDFLDKKEKYYFNAVGVGLPLMLGLNYNSSFKGMATVMRWKILASDKFTLKEVSYRRRRRARKWEWLNAER